jgi:hypothetical protein
MKLVKKNDTNNAAHRTAAQVRSILRSNGVECTVENLGDSRTFYIVTDDSLKTYLAIKNAGFITISRRGGHVELKCW